MWSPCRHGCGLAQLTGEESFPLRARFIGLSVCGSRKQPKTTVRERRNGCNIIASATISTDATHSHVGLEWKGRVFGFTPGPGTWKGEWTLPTLDGKPVDLDPPFVYSSPHLNAAVGSEVVTASYGTNYTLKYDFGDDTITRA